MDWNGKHRRLVARRLSSLVVVALVALSPGLVHQLVGQAAAECRPGSSHERRWSGSWSASPMPAGDGFGEPNEGFEDQTIRQVVHLSLGGRKLRVELSNRYGDAPLTIGTASVARPAGGASIVPGSDRTLTFSGQPSVVIPPGETIVSDPIRFRVAACADLTVSIHVPEATGPATWHELGQQTAYVSSPGEFAGSTDLPVQETSLARFWLSGVEVFAPQGTATLVAFGDSITDGWASTPDENRRWPDVLSHRINRCDERASIGRRHPHGRIGVLNQGISGNRLLRDFVGTAGLARFDDAVLAQAGVTDVIVLIGINDIGLSGALGEPRATAEELVEGLSELAERAHAQGLMIYAGTLTPYEGTEFPGYYSADGEATRQELNTWIRTSDVFDAVLDFDAALRDPEHPTRLLPAYDSGDHLHPSDAGYQAMAAVIDGAMFSLPAHAAR